jgi:tetrahydromethanopterin S-methyltransferase subunit F
MSVVPFDTLKLARSLRERGSMSAEQAEGITVALAEAFVDEIATKQDVRLVQLEVRDLEARMQLLIRDQTIKLGGMLVVAVGAVATLTKFL